LISNSPILCDSNQQTDHPSNFLAFNWQDGRVNAALDVEPVAAKNDRSMLKLNLQDANKKKKNIMDLSRCWRAAAYNNIHESATCRNGSTHLLVEPAE
jgi:hypothetical protein